METLYHHQHKNAGFLRITGDDRLDFIQRQTTNDVGRLAPGTHLSTVLTSPSARIVDVLQLFFAGEEAIGAVTLPGRGPDTALFLKRRIFFMDKVTVTDASTEAAIVDLEGRSLQPAADRLGIQLPAQGEMLETTLQGIPLRAAGQRGPAGRSVRFILPAGEAQKFLAALESAGARAIDAETYEWLRIAAGLPGPAGELTEDYTPLEARLADLISETKGCYTGQEVIARQITYDKITRSLAGIRLSAPVAAGARVLVNGQNVGTVTSSTAIPEQDPLALAVLKRPHFEPGTRVDVEHGEDTVSGTVSDLPFSSE